MKLINISTIKYPNTFCEVDDDDFEELNKRKWHPYKKANTFYAVTSMGKYGNGKKRRVFMHRIIMMTPNGMETDHINRNGLDNRRANLRICTRAENGRNTITKTNTSSRFRGVHFNSKKKKFQALIRVNGIRIHLGYFNLETDAARAYNAAARKHHKEFATLNDWGEA